MIAVVIMMVIIVVVIVSSVAHHTAIRHSHIKRALYAEGQYGIPRNANSVPPRVTALNCSHD